MKRLLTLLALLVSFAQLNAQAQTTTTPEHRPLWVGLDMGGTYQTSDMKPLGGIGWSFTLGRYSRLSKPGPLYFGWRFRFLDGRNYGYTYHALTGAQMSSETSLSQNPTDYADSAAGGVAFANYRFRFDEFAYELIIGDNALRKHGVLLYAFGGIGVNYWKVNSDYLDIAQQRYDYTNVSTNGNPGEVDPSLRLMWDRNYETPVVAPHWSFMPSVGVGFGYQWSNYVALGAEFRSTFSLVDNIDGMSHDANGAKTPNNDIYNYAGGFVRWTFGGGHSHSSDHTTYTPPPPPPNPDNYTHTTTTTTTTTGGNTGGGSQNQTIQRPYVNFITPSYNPYSTNVQSQQLVVHVEHVVSASQISLTINNQYSNNFSFNPSTNTMVFYSTLIPGNNVFMVTATNAAGASSDSQTIIYNSGTNYSGGGTSSSSLPPQVTINNPASDPYTSLNASATVTATVLNVAAASNIQVLNNGNPVYNFNYNSGTHILMFNASLNNGNNLYEVIGTNSVGSASDAVTIIYNPTPVVQPPVVTITNPAVCPYTTKTAAMTITANITNVTMANQVAVVFNNAAVTAFNFVNNGSFATISFPVTLNAGLNNLSVTGTNTAGTNSKSCQLTLKENTIPPAPPVVTITSPGVNPYSTTSPTITFTAAATNITAQSQIVVTYNNAQVSNFLFNASTHVITYPNATLNNGANVFTVTATNNDGSDSKSTTVIYSLPVAHPPVVTITSPGSNPYTSANQVINFAATATNITSQSQVVVTYNNAQVSNFLFNASTHVITYPNATLNNGANVFTVTATNNDGSDSKSTTVIYTVTTVLPPVVHFTIPLANPYLTSVSPMQFEAEVLNVSGASEISVHSMMGGNINFNYNATTHKVTFTDNLLAGANVYTVTATNSAGNASDSRTVKYLQTSTGTGAGGTGAGGSGSDSSGGNSNTGGNSTGGHVINPHGTGTSAGNASGDSNSSSSSNTIPPVVQFIIPNDNPHQTSSSPMSFEAQVLNVSSASEISVRSMMGGSINFNYNSVTQHVTFTDNLLPGANVYTVTATNSAGTASDSRTVKYLQSSTSTGSNDAGGSGQSDTVGRTGHNGNSGNQNSVHSSGGSSSGSTTTNPRQTTITPRQTSTTPRQTTTTPPKQTTSTSTSSSSGGRTIPSSGSGSSSSSSTTTPSSTTTTPSSTTTPRQAPRPR